MQKIELEYINITKVEADNRLTTVSVPVLMSITHLANRAEMFYNITEATNEILAESTYVCDNTLNILNDIYDRLVPTCQKSFKNSVDNTEKNMLILMFFGTGITLLSTIILLHIILKLIGKQKNTLAAFAFIYVEEISELLEASQKLMMRNIKYNPEMVDFLDDEVANEIKQEHMINVNIQEKKTRKNKRKFSNILSSTYGNLNEALYKNDETSRIEAKFNRMRFGK